jgi:hypothetical protein
VQDTNSYVVLPPARWRGYVEPPAHGIHPTEWGAVPPLPSLIDAARADMKDGASMAAVVSRLDTDPGDKLAAALAAMGRAIFGDKA